MSKRRAFSQGLVTTTAALGLATSLACSYWGGRDYYDTQEAVIESKAHTAGEVLSQKKQKMQQAQADLMSIQATLESLRRHRSIQEIELFEPFVRRYLREHVDALLSREEESWHAELTPLDANLLFAKAAVLVELRDRWRLERLIDQIEQRFAGMDSLLVEYPAGKQNTLEQGLRELKSKQWRM